MKNECLEKRKREGRTHRDICMEDRMLGTAVGFTNGNGTRLSKENERATTETVCVCVWGLLMRRTDNTQQRKRNSSSICLQQRTNDDKRNRQTVRERQKEEEELSSRGRKNEPREKLINRGKETGKRTHSNANTRITARDSSFRQREWVTREGGGEEKNKK